MSQFFVNTPITYTAVAATQGWPSDTFAYAWVFDDGGTGNTASLSHTWTTIGQHSATVTATDNSTGGTASATKSGSIISLPSGGWTNTGLNLSQGTSISGYESGKNYLYGNKLITFGVYSHQTDVSVMDMSLGTVTVYAAALPLMMGGSCYVDMGAYAGKILLFGNTAGSYGYWDLSLNTYTQIASSGGPTSQAYGSVPSVSTGNYIVMPKFIDGTASYNPMFFNKLTGVFTGGSTTKTYLDITTGIYLLPSGRILELSASSRTYITTVGGATISGSSFPAYAGVYNFMPAVSMGDGRVFTVGGSYAYIFVEDVNGINGGSWVQDAAYPYLDQSGSATYNVWASLVVVPGGDIVIGSGEYFSGVGQNNTVNEFYSSGAHVFKKFGTATGWSESMDYYYNGYLWAVTNTGAVYKFAWPY